MITIPHTCKFCHKPTLANFDDKNPDIIFKKERWLAWLACNRCADYRMERRRYINAIKSVSEGLWGATMSLSGKKMADKTKSAEDALTNLTKKLATVCCDYYRLTNVWDVGFVEMLIENPRSWLIIVNKYVQGLIKLSEKT